MGVVGGAGVERTVASADMERLAVAVCDQRHVSRCHLSVFKMDYIVYFVIVDTIY